MASASNPGPRFADEAGARARTPLEYALEERLLGKVLGQSYGNHDVPVRQGDHHRADPGARGVT